MTQQKAYLIQLEGMGDHRWYLLDETDWAHLHACDEWNRFDGAPSPVPSEDLITRAMGEGNMDSREEILDCLTPSADSGSASNDVALSMPPSVFNGEQHDDYDGSVKALNAFVAKHDLELIEAYEGSLY